MSEQDTVERVDDFTFSNDFGWPEVRAHICAAMNLWGYSAERQAYVLDRLDSLDPANRLFDGGEAALDRFVPRVLTALSDAYGEIFDRGSEGFDLAPDRQAFIISSLDRLDVASRYYGQAKAGMGAVRGAGFYDLTNAFAGVHVRIAA